MLLQLKDTPTYGPVNSRRLGASLGINPVRPGGKTCTMDCAYCHFGWAAPVSGGAAPEEAFFTPAEVLEAVEAKLASLERSPAFLTFSGNGEPTLHPRFPELVEGVIALRDRLAPEAKTAILSNSTAVHREETRAALARLDQRIMKLDAGTEAVFRRLNRPARDARLEDVLEGLKALEAVTLQSLFAGGPGGNLAPGHVEAWVEAARFVAPVEVQLYTLARDTPSKRLRGASRDELEAIRLRLEKAGVQALVF